MDLSPKNFLEKGISHKSLYKNARGRTPPWKEVYRKRCVERLRASRAQLVNRFRAAGELNMDCDTKAKMVQDIMEVEWSALKQANGILPSKNWSLKDEGYMDGEDESAVFKLMEEIQNELICEEEKLLNDIMSYDSAALASQVTLQHTEEVICPVCQVQALRESAGGNVMDSSKGPFSDSVGGTSNVLTCSCGLALQGANVTLSTVKSSLQNTLSHHGQMCAGKMSFTPTTDTQGTNVLSTCNLCDWMSFLL